MQCPETSLITTTTHRTTIVQGIGQGESIILSRMGMIQEMPWIKKRLLRRNTDISVLPRKQQLLVVDRKNGIL